MKSQFTINNRYLLVSLILTKQLHNAVEKVRREVEQQKIREIDQINNQWKEKYNALEHKLKVEMENRIAYGYF